MSNRFAALLTATGLCSVLLVGCALTVAPERDGPTMTRTVLLSADKHHEGHLGTDMRFMMERVTAIMSLETDMSVSGAERQARVMRELNSLDETARITKDGNEISNYSTTSPYMGSFLHDIKMAKEFAQMDPPDYQPAAGLFKSCQYCHQNR